MPITFSKCQTAAYYRESADTGPHSFDLEPVMSCVFYFLWSRGCGPDGTDTKGARVVNLEVTHNAVFLKIRQGMLRPSNLVNCVDSSGSRAHSKVEKYHVG